MCAIFGVGFQFNTKIGGSTVARKIIRNLFVENMMRGRTASGIAYVRQDEITVLKDAVQGDKFIDSANYTDLETYRMVLADRVPLKDRPYFVMGHCRLKTKGTELDNKNNHPIVRDKVVGVHNGIISNDDALFTRYKNTFDRKATVDSEIIFALIEYYAETHKIHDAISRATQELCGGYGCTMVHTSQPHVLWFFRNHSPCDIFHYKEEGFIVWSSSSYFIEESLKEFNFKKPEIIEFPARTGIAIDFYRNKIFRFEINTSGERYAGYA
jgi:glucosamine 6-phosphate synthetase-like amidotransferase/phosphosugar isomerase protein